MCIGCLKIIYGGADYLNLISPVGVKRIRNNIQASVLNLSITKVFRSGRRGLRGRCALRWAVARFKKFACTRRKILCSRSGEKGLFPVTYTAVHCRQVGRHQYYNLSLLGWASPDSGKQKKNLDTKSFPGTARTASYQRVA